MKEFLDLMERIMGEVKGEDRSIEFCQLQKFRERIVYVQSAAGITTVLQGVNSLKGEEYGWFGGKFRRGESKQAIPTTVLPLTYDLSIRAVCDALPQIAQCLPQVVEGKYAGQLTYLQSEGVIKPQDILIVNTDKSTTLESRAHYLAPKKPIMESLAKESLSEDSLGKMQLRFSSPLIQVEIPQWTQRKNNQGYVISSQIGQLNQVQSSKEEVFRSLGEQNSSGKDAREALAASIRLLDALYKHEREVCELGARLKTIERRLEGS